MQFESKFEHFHPWKCIWKCCLQTLISSYNITYVQNWKCPKDDYHHNIWIIDPDYMYLYLAQQHKYHFRPPWFTMHSWMLCFLYPKGNWGVSTKTLPVATCSNVKTVLEIVIASGYHMAFCNVISSWNSRNSHCCHHVQRCENFQFTISLFFMIIIRCFMMFWVHPAIGTSWEHGRGYGPFTTDQSHPWPFKVVALG